MLLREATHQRLGVAVIVKHPTAGLGRRNRINLWLSDQSPEWSMQMEFDMDLSILLAYRLMDSWKSALNVFIAVENPEDTEKARTFLGRLVDAARLPARTKVYVADEDLGRFSSKAPQADLNIFPLADKLDAEFMFQMRDTTQSSCLFTRDGGDESSLA